MTWFNYKVLLSWSLALSLQILTTSAWGSAEPQFVALGRTQPVPGSTDGFVRLPQTISWPATTLTTRFYGTNVHLNVSTPPHQTDVLSLQSRGVSMPLEIAIKGKLSVTKTCLVGVSDLPCAVQGLPLGNYSLAIRKVQTVPFTAVTNVIASTRFPVQAQRMSEELRTLCDF